MIAPYAPEFFITDLDSCGGRIGPKDEDFQVDEVPAYEPSGSGDHWFVRIQKRGLTTPEAQREVARAAGVAPRDVGSAGMKDRRAVTTQWLSVSAVHSIPPSEWQLPDGLQVLEASRHNNKLRTGQLRGNQFRIRLVDLAPGGVAKAKAMCSRLAERGLPNYFGGQRFGRGGANLSQALEWVARGARAGGKQRFLAKLLPSVLQAELFNRYLARRLAFPLDVPLQGEVVRLEGTKRVFVVEQPEQEQPRLQSGDLVLTGPMLGPKVMLSRDRARELEDEVLSALGVDRTLFERWGRVAPGAFRDLFVRPEGLSVTEVESDENSAWLAFFLPSGSYATQLVRELTRASHIDVPRDA